MKRARSTVKSRAIPPNILEKYGNKIEAIAPQIEKVLQEEREERLLSKAENQHNRAVKLVKGENDDKRAWFQSFKDRKMEKEKLSNRSKELFGSKPKNVKGKRKRDDDEERPKANKGKIHAAKAKTKPKKIRAFVDAGKSAIGKSKARKTSGFAVDLADVSKSNAKRLRYEGNTPKFGGNKKKQAGKFKGKRK